MIRNILSVMPTRPILYIVPVIVVLVLSFYYGDMHSRCTSNKQFRISLNELLHSEGAGTQLRLTDVTRFVWDRVRIVTNFKPESRNNECPFGWNWPDGERDSLIASGLLTVLIFVDHAAIVEYFELRSDEVAFRGADFSLSPAAAVFAIGANSDNSTGVTLTLNN
jgi:hypothetical protein